MQKSIVITGSSSGIGLVAANDLLRRGYHVIAACRKPQDVERMNELGFSGVLLDLDDATSVEHAAGEILALWEAGRLGSSRKWPLRGCWVVMLPPRPASRSLSPRRPVPPAPAPGSARGRCPCAMSPCGRCPVSPERGGRWCRRWRHYAG